MSQRTPDAFHLGPDAPPVPIVFIDDAVVAVDKPAGLLAVPDRWDKDLPSLMSRLNAGILVGAGWAVDGGFTYLANAHRLDRDTTGVMVLGRTPGVLRNLVRQFEDRGVSKVYLALIRGILPGAEMTVDRPIGPDPSRPGFARAGGHGSKKAITVFKRLEAFRGYELVECRPQTGRMHQIRVHLQTLRCPLVADVRYGDGKGLCLSKIKRGYKGDREAERPLIGRQALHALSVDIEHPGTGAPLHIEAPWPKDLRIAVKYLRQFAGM
jgi:RluA family pseudouridine synthase